MTRPQVIVTSYARPRYLIPCLESLRQDDVDLFVVDGGSDTDTRKAIERLADNWWYLADNPGADVLKNEGVKRFVTQPRFIITSDDLIYPKGYSARLLEQYDQLNAGGPGKWTMCACSTQELITDYYGKNLANKYTVVNGVEIMEVGISMVSGAVIDTEAWRRVGGFPIYGKTGCGDVAISLRLRKIGYRLGYFANPVVKHVGLAKATDYPEYSKAFKIDEDFWYEEARKDNWTP